MTDNGYQISEVIIRATANLGPGYHSSRELAIQARKDGFLMTTDKARRSAQDLTHRGILASIKDTYGHYWFGAP